MISRLLAALRNPVPDDPAPETCNAAYEAGRAHFLRMVAAPPDAVPPVAGVAAPPPYRLITESFAHDEKEG